MSASGGPSDSEDFGDDLDWTEDLFRQLDQTCLNHDQQHRDHDAALSTHKAALPLEPAESSTYPQTRSTSAPRTHSQAASLATGHLRQLEEDSALPHIVIEYEPPLPLDSSTDEKSSLGAEKLVDDVLLSAVVETGSGGSGTTAQTPNQGQERKEKTKSLFEEFRGYRKSLSVSDLVSPAWCEQQTFYGLLSRRSQPPHLRPDTVINPQTGASIQVDKPQTIARQVILDAGSAVHEKLERETLGEVVRVWCRSKEEEWGLKMLNAIVGLQGLLRDGMTRELPVWGFIDRFLVLGVIDQLDLVREFAPLPSSPPPAQTPGMMEYYFKPSVKNGKGKEKSKEAKNRQ